MPNFEPQYIHNPLTKAAKAANMIMSDTSLHVQNSLQICSLGVFIYYVVHKKDRFFDPALLCFAFFPKEAIRFVQYSTVSKYLIVKIGMLAFGNKKIRKG